MDCSSKSFPYPTPYTPVSEDSERLKCYSGLTCNCGDILRYRDFSLPLDMLVYIPGDAVVKNLPTNVGDTRDASLIPALKQELPEKFPWSRKWQPTPIFLPGKSHGQRGLLGYSPWGFKESDTTEQMRTQQTHKC